MTGRKHTKNIPQENRKFAEILIEHSAVPTFVLNTDHKVVIWNRACTALTGFPSSQMIGTDNQWKPFYDHKRPCLSDIVLDADFNELPDLYPIYGKSALSPGALYAEGRYQSLNGKDRYILFEAAPVYDGKRRLIAAIETLQDVTESRQAKDLRESEDKFRNLAERSLVGIYLIQDGLFRYVNPRLAEIFGYEVDELLHTKTPKELVLEEDWPLVEQNLLKRLSGEVETRYYGFRGITKQGEIVFIEVYGTRTIYQARPAVIGTLLDITERNKAEAELRKSEEAYRRIVETASEGIWSVDSQYRTTFVNTAMTRMMGYAYEEMLETPVERYIFDEDLEDHRLRMEVRRSGVSEHFERRYRRKDGDVCWCLVSATPLQDSEGRFVGSFFMCTDITKRKGVEDAQRKSEAKLILFKSLIDQVNDAVFVADPETSRLLDVNNTACNTLGYEREELLKMTVLDLGHPGMSDLSAWETHVAETKNKRHMVMESQQRRKDGTTLPVEINTNYVSHDARDYMVAIIRDVTERKKVEEQLHSLAYYDTLTGLPNRALFKELLQRALEYAKRYNRTFSIFFIDLDDFKRVNDTLGHDVGDELLQVVADRLLKSMRTSDCLSRSNEKAITDVVSRQGGDEFILLLHNLIKPADAAHVAGRILKGLAEPYELNGREVFITASIGISSYPEDGDNIDSILKNADTAIYQAKIKGKNNYQFYSIEMNNYSLEQLTLEGDLHRAIERSELVLHYQPKVACSTGNIIGVEALVRWQHPHKGLIHPGQFIPLAEAGNLIIPIGELVLHVACLQNKMWQEAGIKPMSVAVNLSGRQFDQKDLIKMVRDALNETRLSPQYLELEITESTVMRNPEEAIQTLKELKEMGIRIAVDDFGTGYSSLSYLKQLPLDCLKIDRSFIKNVSSNVNDATIVRTIIAMAHGMNMEVIAEGVETERQSGFLQEHGCDAMQGFLFYRPLPAEDISKLIAKGML